MWFIDLSVDERPLEGLNMAARPKDGRVSEASQSGKESVGCVIIGRNEGARFERCLEAVLQQEFDSVVYVDSGSTDGSIAFAEAAGAAVLRLDTATPFTAARARNAGFYHLAASDNKQALVQFLDGDCVLVAGWLERARTFLDGNHQYAAVCGRRRERFPNASIYNKLCDIEWNTKPGEALAFGGDVLIRSEDFASIEGFREDLICGEEPELGIRLRERGGRIFRLDADMTLHDAGMTRFSQWWMRTVRGGYGFAKVAYLYRRTAHSLWRREVLRAVVYGGAIPAAAIIGSAFQPYALALLLVYPLSFARTVMRSRLGARERGIYAGFMVIGKFAEFQGICKFAWDWVAGRSSKIIEYKKPASNG